MGGSPPPPPLLPHPLPPLTNLTHTQLNNHPLTIRYICSNFDQSLPPTFSCFVSFFLLQRLSTVHEPADYEEVEFPPPTTNHHCIGVYDVLRKECQYEEEDDAIYDVPPDT